MDEDLAEGVNTYPSARIRYEGDSPALRREIKVYMLALAGNSIEAGTECLSTKEQRAIYRTLKTMIDLKYKVVDRLH